MKIFLENLLGNPKNDTFLYWIADGGFLAILIIIFSMIIWLLLKSFIKSKLNKRLTDITKQEIDKTIDIYTSGLKSIEGKYFNLFSAIIIIFIAVILIYSVLGNNVDPLFNILKQIGESLLHWILIDGIRILTIIILSFFSIKISKNIIPKLLTSIMLGQSSTSDHEEILKRSQTLSGVFVGAIIALIYILAIFMILSELSIPIAPVIGGFGIAGIAVGFGAQHLVRDLISGVFILAENQYRRGDVVTIAGISGLVESINLRRTILRDLDGQVHIIPNGEITVASNKTKYWSRVNLDIGVAYKENIEKVVSLLNEIGKELSNDEYYGLMLITPPQVLRLNSLDDSAVTFKILGDCKPMKQWEIMGELRKRIKIKFDEENIEIPFPHQTVYWGENQSPFKESKSKIEIDNKDIIDEKNKLPNILTPEKREELLADKYSDLKSRILYSEPDDRTNTKLLESSDSE
ncbi:MAG: hypothetical protein CL748_05375 [Chloroflexi bacterium]|nr:hypothetical protein [Chloroflexota bacterium]